MGFNTFRGDNRPYSVNLLAPPRDRALRALSDERAWMQACAAMRPLDQMTSPDYGRPITGVIPTGGMNTDPAFAYGLSFSLAHGAIALPHSTKTSDYTGASRRSSAS